IVRWVSPNRLAWAGLWSPGVGVERRVRQWQLNGEDPASQDVPNVFSVLGAPPKPLGMITRRAGDGVHGLGFTRKSNVRSSDKIAGRPWPPSSLNTSTLRVDHERAFA